MKQFEVGKIYSMRSPFNNEALWTYRVIARTAKTIIIEEMFGWEVKKCRILKASKLDNVECVLPLGNYSMSPVLRADKHC